MSEQCKLDHRCINVHITLILQLVEVELTPFPPPGMNKVLSCAII